QLAEAAAPHDLLVSKDAEQDNGAHNHEIERARNAEQIDQVLQHLQQDGDEHDAEHRAFPAAQAAAAEDGGRDRIKLVEVAMRGGRDRARIHGEENSGETGKTAADDV